MVFKSWVISIMVAFLGLVHSQVYAGDELLMHGSFVSKALSVRVKGEVEVYRDGLGRDYMVLKDFFLGGGVVLDVKICGDIDEGYPFENLCVSNGTPPTKTKNYSLWVRSRSFIRYKKVVIFDADLAMDLAEAVLVEDSPVLPVR